MKPVTFRKWTTCSASWAIVTPKLPVCCDSVSYQSELSHTREASWTAKMSSLKTQEAG